MIRLLLLSECDIYFIPLIYTCVTPTIPFPYPLLAFSLAAAAANSPSVGLLTMVKYKTFYIQSHQHTLSIYVEKACSPYGYFSVFLVLLVSALGTPRTVAQIAHHTAGSVSRSPIGTGSGCECRPSAGNTGLVLVSLLLRPAAGPCVCVPPDHESARHRRVVR